MRVRTLALAGLSTVLLTACSSTIEGSASPAGASPDGIEVSGRTGPELEEQAVSALEEAGAVRVQGRMTMDGEPAELDMRLRGDDAAGSMVLQGHDVQVVAVDGSFFMQAPAELWAAQGVPPRMATSLGGTWVLVPGGDGDVEDLSFAGLVEEMRSPGATTEEEVGSSQLDGRPVWELRNSEGDVMLVAAEGTPYPLQITSTGDEPGVMRLSEFGTVAPIEPPADYLDLEDLGG